MEFIHDICLPIVYEKDCGNYLRPYSAYWEFDELGAFRKAMELRDGQRIDESMLWICHDEPKPKYTSYHFQYDLNLFTVKVPKCVMHDIEWDLDFIENSRSKIYKVITYLLEQSDLDNDVVSERSKWSCISPNFKEIVAQVQNHYLYRYVGWEHLIEKKHLKEYMEMKPISYIHKINQQNLKVHLKKFLRAESDIEKINWLLKKFKNKLYNYGTRKF